MKIIAFAGMPCSGKSEAVRIAKEMNIPVIWFGFQRNVYQNSSLAPSAENKQLRLNFSGMRAELWQVVAVVTSKKNFR